MSKKRIPYSRIKSNKVIQGSIDETEMAYVLIPSSLTSVDITTISKLIKKRHPFAYMFHKRDANLSRITLKDNGNKVNKKYRRTMLNNTARFSPYKLSIVLINGAGNKKTERKYYGLIFIPAGVTKLDLKMLEQSLQLLESRYREDVITSLSLLTTKTNSKLTNCYKKFIKNTSIPYCEIREIN